MTEEPFDFTTCGAIDGRMITFDVNNQDDLTSAAAATESFLAAHPSPQYVRVDESDRFGFLVCLRVFRMMAYEKQEDYEAWLEQLWIKHQAYIKANRDMYHEDGRPRESRLKS